MVKPQFKQLDVESMGRLYEKKERKQKLAQLKRQREREEQQQPRSLFPPTPPTALEPDIGNLGATEAQIIGYTSGDSPNFPGYNLGFNFFENLDMVDIAHTIESLISPSEMDDITTATTGSFSPDKIQPHPKPRSPRIPLLGHPTEKSSQEEANPLLEELPVAPSLNRRATGQLHTTSSVLSGRNTVVDEDEEISKSGETRKSCDADDSAAEEIDNSDEDDTHGETCIEELAVPGPKLMFQDSSGIPASQILSGSNSATPDSMESPSSEKSPVPSLSIDAPAVSLDRVEKPQTNVFAIPTPSSHHASVSRQGGDAIISRGKRGRGAIEDGGESHDRRLPKRRRARDADSGTASPTLPSRTLRAIPSRDVADETAKRDIATQRGRKLRRSSRSQPRSRAAGPISSVPGGKDHSHLDGLPTLNLGNASGREKHTAQREHSPTTADGTIPRLDHCSRNLSSQRSGRVSLPPVATKTELSSATCHTCGFSAEYLLRMSDTVQVLVGSGVESSGRERALDMLQLFVGFIRNYAAERLTCNTGRTEHNYSADAMNRNHPEGATGGLSNAETAEDDETSHDNSGHDSDSESSSSSDRNESPDMPMGRVKRPPRRRWEPLEDARLRAWVQEGKEWTWMANRLDRSEQALIQHWAIIGKQDRKRAKK